MTQLRKFRDAISNYFDELLDGIGHRGSSFSDIDAVTQDETTDRYLFQEFKGPDEDISAGQSRLLKGLARREYLTVWCVRRRSDGLLEWRDIGTERSDVITVAEYQARFRRWWTNQPIVKDGAQVCVHRDEFKDDGVCWICTHTAADVRR